MANRQGPLPPRLRPGRSGTYLSYRDRVIEVVGDASRGVDWACVRLGVVGDRIVEADADGLERQLVGLTLLEAAAVRGEPMAVDALADALGHVFRASPDSERVAVAMSGGVDSAVALLRAGPEAVGVTLRLWLDPEGPDAERACCSPEAVIAARETCHALGRPHVTLDLREEFRRAVVEPGRLRIASWNSKRNEPASWRTSSKRRCARPSAARARAASREVITTPPASARNRSSVATGWRRPSSPIRSLRPLPITRISPRRRSTEPSSAAASSLIRRPAA